MLSARLFDKIDGVMYDTKRSKYLGYAQYGEGNSFVEYKLYQTFDAYFIHVYGASGSEYAIRDVNSGQMIANQSLVLVNGDVLTKLQAQIIEYNTSHSVDVEKIKVQAPVPVVPASQVQIPIDILYDAIALLKHKGYNLEDIAKAYLNLK